MSKRSIKKFVPYSGCVDLELLPDMQIVQKDYELRDCYPKSLVFRFMVQNSDIVAVTMLVLFESKVQGKRVNPILLNDLRPYGFVNNIGSLACMTNLEVIIERVLQDDAVCFLGRDGRWRDCRLTIWKPDQSTIRGEKKGDSNYVRLSGTTEFGSINYQCRTSLPIGRWLISDILIAFSEHLHRFSESWLFQ